MAMFSLLFFGYNNKSNVSQFCFEELVLSILYHPQNFSQVYQGYFDFRIDRFSGSFYDRLRGLLEHNPGVTDYYLSFLIRQWSQAQRLTKTFMIESRKASKQRSLLAGFLLSFVLLCIVLGIPFFKPYGEYTHYSGKCGVYRANQRGERCLLQCTGPERH